MKNKDMVITPYEPGFREEKRPKSKEKGIEPERVKRRMNDLEDLLDRGFISKEEYNLGLERLAKALRKWCRDE